jgi:hypothetical protein
LIIAGPTTSRIVATSEIGTETPPAPRTSTDSSASSDRRAADRGHDPVLHVAEREAVVADAIAVDLELHVRLAADVLDVGPRHAGHGGDAILDLPGDRFELLDRRLGVERLAVLAAWVADELDRQRSADARVEHDHARLDRLQPRSGSFGRAGRVHHGHQLLADVVLGVPLAPLVLRLELHHRFEHPDRRRVERALGAAELAYHLGDLRHRAHRLVLATHHLEGFVQAGLRQQRRHVEQAALVERRHELLADSGECLVDRAHDAETVEALPEDRAARARDDPAAERDQHPEGEDETRHDEERRLVREDPP